MVGKKTIYEIGQSINGLKFIQDAGYHILPSGVKIRKALFECVCGKRFGVVVNSVTSGRTSSCGCLKNKTISAKNKKHGLWSHELYKTWLGEKSRCSNPKATGFNNWGGRGINFSDEFLDINNWIDYVTSLPNYEQREILKLTLDRIDNNGHYEKGNLRWVDRKTQNENTRKNKSD